jgi:hypothetical protein
MDRHLFCRRMFVKGEAIFPGLKNCCVATLDQTPTQNDIKDREGERDVQPIADRKARRSASFLELVSPLVFQLFSLIPSRTWQLRRYLPVENGLLAGFRFSHTPTQINPARPAVAPVDLHALILSSQATPRKVKSELFLMLLDERNEVCL